MTDQKAAKLTRLLQQEIQWVKELITLLTEEKTALSARQFNNLENLAEQKELLSGKLEQSAKERMELLEINHHENQAKVALQAFLTHCSAEEVSEINQLNNHLAEELTTCRELNTINGQVISSNLSRRQELITILSGQSSSAAIDIYTAHGDVKKTAESHRHEEA
ncbi:flagella synthesis protein FlgN [Legionella fairfieldensis]|uniref:flagella synthesis protein FlgN n=1 Tax=Legionella fairfieldensis TaxID=45064 RepID=UPI0004912C61|nr:flagellar protein FlgN [Legionella fairfieldensis]